MNTPETWSTRAYGWVGQIRGRIAWAVTTADGHTAAAALPDEATRADAAEALIIHLATELNQVGVDFHTTYAPLADALSEPALLAAAGLNLSHVTLVAGHQLEPGDTGILNAEAAAAAAVDEVGPRYLRAATDGGRTRRAHNAASAQGGYGWVIEDGRHGFGPLVTTCALESELVAIVRLLENTSAHQPLLIEVDSRAAIAHAKAALAGLDAPEQATRATASVLSRIRGHAGREVTFTWVKGHSELAMNEAAHELARLGRRGVDLYGSAELVADVASRIVADCLAAEAAQARAS